MAAEGRHFPHWIEAVVDLSHDIPSPLIFRRWAAISAVAGMLGRKCWFDFGSYRTSPAQYIILIGGSGSGKGAALSLPYNEIFAKVALPIRAYNIDQPSYSNNFKIYGLEKPVYLVKDKTTMESVVVKASRITRPEIDLMSPVSGPFLNSSATILTHEFGTFMERNDSKMQNFLTDIWDWKDDYSYETKTASDFYIKGPCFNWIAGATPDGLTANLPEGAHTHGLSSRLVLINYTGPRFQDPAFTKKVEYKEVRFLCEDLADIGNIIGEFKFSPEAEIIFTNWYEAGGEPVPDEPIMEYYRSRRKSHLGKLCMAISASKRSNRVVTLEDLREAWALLFEIEAQLPDALGLFNKSYIARMTDDLLKYVKAKGVPRHRLMGRIIERARTVQEAQTIIKTWEEAGLIKVDGSMILRGPNYAV